MRHDPPRFDVGAVMTLTAGKAAATVLAVATGTYLGHWLGPHEYGRWMLMAGAGTLLHAALVNWTHASTTRWGREEFVRTGLVSRNLADRAPLLAAGLLVAAALLWFNPFAWLERWYSLGRSSAALVAIWMISVWLAAEAQATLQAVAQLRLQGILATIVAAMSLVAVVVGARLTPPTAEALSVVYAGVPIAVWGVVWLRTVTMPAASFDRTARQGVIEQFRYASPMLPGFLLGYISTWSAPLLLSTLATMSDVGVYGVASQFQAALISINAILPTLVLPWLIARQMSDPGAAHDYVSNYAPALLAAFMLAMIWLVALAPPLLEWVAGQRLAGAVGCLLWLLSPLPSSAITSLYTVLFDLQGRLRYVALYLCPATLVAIVTGAMAIRPLGATGAALGAVGAVIVGQVLYIWDQHAQVRVPARRMWWLWGTGLGLGFAQVAIGTSLVNRLVWAITSTLVIVAVVRATRSVTDAAVLAVSERHPPLGLLTARLFMPRSRG